MNFSKNKKVILIMFFSFIYLGAFSQADLKTLQILYKNSQTLSDKIEITKTLLDNPSKDMEPFVINILNDQSVYSVLNKNDQALFNEWVYYTAQIINKEDIKNGAQQIKKIFDKVTDFNYKSEIVLTAGKMGDKALLPWLNNLLDITNNNNRDGKKDYTEGYVYNLVLALGYFNDTSSFKYLFYVANPGYASKIRKLAQEKLKSMTNDPAPYCAEYIKTETNQPLILNALYYAINSDSSTDNKILACKTALLVSMKTGSSETQKDIQDEVRDESTYYLGEFKAGSKDVIELISKKWDFDNSINSKLITIQALEKISNEDSCKVLVDKLNYFIDKVTSGAKLGMNEQDGNKLIVALIRSIGNIPNNIGTEELTLLTISSYFGDIVKREATNALKKKPKQ